jgi:CheY-like chemotaxis protein
MIIDGKMIDWSGKTILVAEDMPVNFLLIEAILKGTNAKLIWARNGKEAVDKCLSNEAIDLVLMDIQMPEMNGIEATQRIRQHRKHLPIIAQTAYTMNDEEISIMEAGCARVLTKPFMPDLIIKAIRPYLEYDGNIKSTI